MQRLQPCGGAYPEYGDNVYYKTYSSIFLDIWRVKTALEEYEENPGLELKNSISLTAHKLDQVFLRLEKDEKFLLDVRKHIYGLKTPQSTHKYAQEKFKALKKQMEEAQVPIASNEGQDLSQRYSKIKSEIYSESEKAFEEQDIYEGKFDHNLVGRGIRICLKNKHVHIGTFQGRDKQGIKEGLLEGVECEKIRMNIAVFSEGAFSSGLEKGWIKRSAPGSYSLDVRHRYCIEEERHVLDQRQGDVFIQQSSRGPIFG